MCARFLHVLKLTNFLSVLGKTTALKTTILAPALCLLVKKSRKKHKKLPKISDDVKLLLIMFERNEISQDTEEKAFYL